MKAFLDRFYYYCGGEQQGLLKGKEAVLAVVYEEVDPHAADATLDMFRRSFDYLGMNFRHRLIVPGVGAKGEIWKKTKRIEEAYSIGQSLAG
jgi:multimeric flavodoxin WrbA